MALDPSIILQAGKGIVPLKSQGEINEEAALGEMRQLQLRQAKQGITDDQAYRDVLRSGATGADQVNALQRAGLGKQAMEAQKFQTDQAKTQREAEKAKLESSLKQFEVMGQIMSGVKDQATYDAAREQAARIFGPDAMANIPPVYDQAAVERNRLQAMTVKDQLAQRWKEIEFNTPSANARLQAETSTRGQNMADARARELAAIRSQEVAQTKQLTQEKNNLDRVDKKVTAFATQLDKTNIPQFESLLGDIEGEISKFTQQGDIPGFGKTGSLPQFLLSPEGKTLRQKIAQLQNLTLKDRSGAAVTNQELQRLLNELGTGVFSTDAQLITGLEQVRRNLDAVKQNVVAGVDDDTLAEYQNRGGMTLKRGPKPKQKAMNIGGRDVMAELAPDGKYYVQQNGEWFEVKQ